MKITVELFCDNDKFADLGIKLNELKDKEKLINRFLVLDIIGDE